ncbi:FAD/NAD(P)-binding protein [Ideonella margarita]|uniref:FAD/NAD(P)-binding protein n=1 Tax=Ideonella margarita TaxID=2984191 RepID=A0ABU9C428_9BURK
MPTAQDPPVPPGVIVIGAGFCGVAVVARLATQCPPGTHLTVLEQGPRWGRGLAYGTRSSSHWLNVPAGRLGLDPDHEAGFHDWLQQVHPGHAANAFVPRMWLGDYLCASLQAATELAQQRGLTVTHEMATAVDWLPAAAGQAATVMLSDGRVLQARAVVLATGHLPPSPPALPRPVSGPDAVENDAPHLTWGAPGLMANPWQLELLDGLDEDAEVLVLGSGLTAIDMVTVLQDQGHQGRITLLSRRGLLPQPHRSLEARPRPGLSPVAELGDESRLRPMLRAVRRWMSEAAADQRDWRDVMASLRGCTPSLWQRLSLRDRRQFLRHLQPWWDTHRHRLAPGIHRRLQGAMAAGQVALQAGRLLSVDRSADGALSVRWQRRGGPVVEARVALLVNCTGATTGLSRASTGLLARLRQQGVLTPDALDLGVLVDEQHRPLDTAGHGRAGLYYVGPMLKAQWWEAVAVPELRRHARQVADAVAVFMAELEADASADGATASPADALSGPACAR